MALSLGQNGIGQSGVSPNSITLSSLSGSTVAYFVAFTYRVIVGPFTLSDSHGDTFTPISQSPVGASFILETYKCISPSVHASEIFSLTGTGATTMFVAEVVDSSPAAFDASNAAAYFDTTADPGSISVVTNSIVFAALCANRTTGSFTAPTGYTSIQFANDNGFSPFLQAAYKLSPSATEDPTWVGNGFQGGCCVLSIKPSGGGGASKVNQLPTLGVS